METKTDMEGTNIKQSLDLHKETKTISLPSLSAKDILLQCEETSLIKRSKIIIQLSEKEFAYDLWVWRLDSKTKGYICESYYRQGVIDFLTEKNFTRFVISADSELFIQEVDGVIKEISINEMLRITANYINNLIEVVNISHPRYGEIVCRKVIFKEIHNRQFNGIFNINFLQHLAVNEKKVLSDNRNESFILFKNNIVKVTRDGLQLLDYEDDFKNNVVWDDHIIQRPFEYIEQNTEFGFGKFLQNVCNSDANRFEALRCAIGYLCHRYKPKEQAHAVILNDEEISENPEGGTGKTLIRQALEKIRNVVEINGKEFNSNDQYKWNLITPTSQIVVIDDIKKNFNFEYLFSCLTGGWTVESKFRNKFTIPAENSPKVLITSNYPINRNGASNLRRQLVYELSNYYSKQIISGTEEPIKNDVGMLWGEDFSQEDWNIFYSFMIDCIRLYLEKGVISITPKNNAHNFLIHKTTKDFAQFIYEDDFLNSNSKFIFSDVVSYFNDNYCDPDDPIKSNTLTKYFKAIQGKKFSFKRSNGKNYLIVNI